MKLQALEKYHEIKAGQAFEFGSKNARTIRIEFLTVALTVLTISTADQTVSVGLEPGQQKIQFETVGETVIEVDQDAAFYTAELYTVHAENLNDKKFTKVAVRQERNPELEKIAASVMANAERRMSTQMKEMQALQEAQIAALKAERELEKQQKAKDEKPDDDKSTSADSDDQPKPAKPADAQPSGEDGGATPEGGDDKGGDGA